ncbi:LOW QUALITY PROTEIN: xanthine dehydrogenase, molybdenum binding subunit [Geomicrobium sp. JCM 19055]|nr:LOW QUALITY PROTEIN: xanthine dehydrogenase, molybdenum binding subunit [Geomicrobium sp. JCM 19055]
MSKSRKRPDGNDKVTGQLAYLTDRTFPEMLYAKVLRSAYPHALIRSICTERAKELPGVKAIITHQDVSGVNGFGIITPDQPVFCDETVRFIGDAVAAVAATSVEVAEEAIKRIDVTYDVLPVLDDPVKSLAKNAPKLRDDGNVLYKKSFTKGDVAEGFKHCTAVVEETYHVPRQMHAYMETEGGVVVPEADGGITVYMGTQHGFKDQFQLSRILDVPKESIRIVSSPMGGSFGGKDELNVQPYAALLALKTNKPVKLHQTRAESVISSIKRHPMAITIKTGADETGKVIAHDVKIVADTGPYATLGPAILDFAVEHSAGPYRFEHIAVDGTSVLTNNAVSGEFRGFGGNQITFALENQMDRLAEQVGMCPLALRKLNLRGEHDLGPLEQRIVPTTGASDVLENVERLKDQLEFKKDHPFVRTGVGIAMAMHGGDALGVLDGAGGRLSLSDEGKIDVSFGFEEVGQGIVAVIEELTIAALQCDEDDITITIGDTNRVPHSGSTTASRGTSMVWHALERMKQEFKEKLCEQAALITDEPVNDLCLGTGGIYKGEEQVLTYRSLREQVTSEANVVVETTFDFPTTPDEVDGGHYLYTFAGVLAAVEVDLLTGQVTVTHLHQAISAGEVVNELGYKGQIEGGGVMSLGYSIMEDMGMEQGHYLKPNFDTYMLPTISDVPRLTVDSIEKLPDGDVHGPRGVGEIGTVAVAPAITKAIHDALGIWINKIPVDPSTILQAVEKEGATWWNEFENEQPIVSHK